METKPSIVFAHGIWADGSSFSKVVPALQAEGYEVICSQHSLDTVKGDVATVIRTLGRVSSPAILVGHSCGGTLITAAGIDDRVVALVYIAALAPDKGETSQSQLNQFPRADVFSHIEVADGHIWNPSSVKARAPTGRRLRESVARAARHAPRDVVIVWRSLPGFAFR